MEGTSTIHDWEVKGLLIGGFMEVDSAALDKAAPGPLKANVQATIPVALMKSQVSPGGSAMDEVMQEHMNFKTYKTITYKLSELTIKEAKDPKGPITCDAKGELTVSGKTNTVSFPVTLTRPDANSLKITSGKVPLKMSAFGIKPPNPKIGPVSIITGDEVTITLDWLTAKAQ
jgi:polyisoprenoid-binding protein YceI